MTAKAKGNQGSWFAEVEAPRHPEVDGKSLPCIWDYWVHGGTKYVDPGYAAGNSKAQKVVEALRRDGFAVMRKRGKDEGKAWRSAGYIAVFEVANVEFDEALTFDIVRRVCELR
ncbi:hypothetical protein [Erythrobacter sp. AP23]|uniref:hypothetical protein n=1 Tax=Erythrobacter sp. AP23 TaxID=499656 RepID=UPI000A84D54C|nr:hypothetical protein [Erythrobacter sp. AP23]